jgi:hypothetical protein
MTSFPLSRKAGRGGKATGPVGAVAGAVIGGVAAAAASPERPHECDQPTPWRRREGRHPGRRMKRPERYPYGGIPTPRPGPLLLFDLGKLSGVKAGEEGADRFG